MRKQIFLIFSFLLVFMVAFSSPSSSSTTTTLDAVLEGGQEVPPVPSPGIGFALLTYDSATNILGWQINFTGLIGNVTAAHFHGPAPAGVNAGVQVDIGVISGLISPMVGTTIITEAQEADLLGELWYINIHTNAFPPGEIRGQVLQVIQPNIPPVCDANGPYSGSAGSPVQFDGSGSFDPDGEIILHEWDFDDDGAFDATGEMPMHTYGTGGIFTITVTVTDDDGDTDTCTTTAEITEDNGNNPPDCSGASPSVNMLWPPNHKFASVNVLGVTDPDGDPVTITIDSIFQDEPVRKDPDGMGVGTSTAQIRSERNGKDNGRVYEISFTTDDGQGGSCSGVVYVSVPHDQSGMPAIDDGPLYDSTTE